MTKNSSIPEEPPSRSINMTASADTLISSFGDTIDMNSHLSSTSELSSSTLSYSNLSKPTFNDQSWKAVGSGLRRSTHGPLQLANSLHHLKSTDDLNPFHRTRTGSIPNLFNASLTSFNTTAPHSSSNSPPDSIPAKWSQMNPAIWQSCYSRRPSSPSTLINPGDEFSSVLSSSFPKESYMQPPQLNDDPIYYKNNHPFSNDNDNLFSSSPNSSRTDFDRPPRYLPTMEEENISSYDHRTRSRSKSQSLSSNENIPIKDSNRVSPSDNYWFEQNSSFDPNTHLPKQSIGVTNSSIWENQTQSHTSGSYPNLSRDYLLSQRRFSYAPTVGSSPVPHSLNSDPYFLHRPSIDHDLTQFAHRRHSLAGPTLYAQANSQTRLLSALESWNLDEPPRAHYTPVTEDSEHLEDLDSSSLSDGKGVPISNMSPSTKLFLIEFKPGRRDFFYLPEGSNFTVKRDDLVIVEADRGKDLGKIVEDLFTVQQLQYYDSTNADLIPELSRNKDINPKRIYRLALPNEISLLPSKSQDETKAMMVCQAKVRQKKLPMEVVDAEYQWDRRKLTFYFIADRRIDFRDLVRDLFKIYKTRIWMCAVNPLKK